MVNCILLIEMAEQRRLGFYFFFNWLKICFSKIIQNLYFPSSIREWIRQLWSCSSWAGEGRKNPPIASFVFHFSRQRLKPMCEISESPTNLVWKPLAKKMNVYGYFVSNGGEGGDKCWKGTFSFYVEQLCVIVHFTCRLNLKPVLLLILKYKPGAPFV